MRPTLLLVPCFLALSLACAGGGKDGETTSDTELDLYFNGTSCVDDVLEVEAAGSDAFVAVDLTLYDGPDVIDTWALSPRGSGWIVDIPPADAGLDTCEDFDGLFALLTGTTAGGREVTAEDDLSIYGE